MNQPYQNHSCRFSSNGRLPNVITTPVYPSADQFMSPREVPYYYPENNNEISARCHEDSSFKSPQHCLRTTFKKKRKRILFTTEQLLELEKVFKKKKYISSAERKVLMNELQVNEQSIKVWFQNKRRLAGKTASEKQETSPSDVTDTFLERVMIIESKINRCTDLNGYVRLDDDTMTELAKVIDEYMSRDPKHDVETASQPIENFDEALPFPYYQDIESLLG